MDATPRIGEIRRLALAVQAVFDAHPDPPPPALSLHDRYCGAGEGGRLPPVRREDAEQAGDEAEREFRKAYETPPPAPGRDGDEARRDFDRGLRESRVAGMRAYLARYVVEELTAVSDPNVLRDLGIHLNRVTGGALGEGEVPSVLAAVARALAETGQSPEPLAPVVLGVALDRGRGPEDETRPPDDTIGAVLNGLPPDARTQIFQAVRRLQARTTQEEEDRRAAAARVRRERYRRAAALLADEVKGQALGPAPTVDLVAQVVFRTSAGYFHLKDEFRAALRAAFSDPEFGDKVDARVLALAQEREDARVESEWNASGTGHRVP